jgi:hypothetical protein
MIGRLPCSKAMVNAAGPCSTSKMFVGRDRLEVYLPGKLRIEPETGTAMLFAPCAFRCSI